MITLGSPACRACPSRSASKRRVVPPPGMETRFARLPRSRLFYGCLLVVPLLLDGLVVLQNYGVDLEVKDDANISCLYAKWMVNISITYEGNSGFFKTSNFMLPDDVSYLGTSCGNSTTGPVLAIEFGGGHLWVIRFTKTKDTYQGIISFTYNTADTGLFPDAKKKERHTVSMEFPAQPVKLNTSYYCENGELVKTDTIVQTFHNVILQAFLQDGKLSKQKTLCEKDGGSPREAAASLEPESREAELSSPEINVWENTSHSKSEKPAMGNYAIKSDTTACLLANMGLRLIIPPEPPQLLDFNPNTTVATGHCGQLTAVLRLNDGNKTVEFLFAVKNETEDKFYLKGLDIFLTNSTNGTLQVQNHSLEFWSTSMGSSYLCRNEETIFVGSGYKVNIFDLKIQPFGIEDGQFSPAQECLLDDDSVLIPIVVGAALAGLIVIIVTTYLIGRRRSHAGYQTL